MATLDTLGTTTQDVDAEQYIDQLPVTGYADANLPAADEGQFYTFSESGTIALNGVDIDVQRGDWLRCSTDGTAAGDGSAWAFIPMSPSRPIYRATTLALLIADSANAKDNDIAFIEARGQWLHRQSGSWFALTGMSANHSVGFQSSPDSEAPVFNTDYVRKRVTLNTKLTSNIPGVTFSSDAHLRIEIANEHATEDRSFVFESGSYIDIHGEDVGTIILSAGQTMILNFDQSDAGDQIFRGLRPDRDVLKVESANYTLAATDFKNNNLSYLKLGGDITLPDGVATADNELHRATILNTSATDTTIAMGASVAHTGSLTVEPNRAITIIVVGDDDVDVIGGA